MKRKLQVAFTDETWNTLEALTKEANEGFKHGCITYSDIVNEIVSSAKIDFRTLQAKHTNIRKSLRLMASQPEIDIDSAIRALNELKARAQKKGAKASLQLENGES